MDTTAAEDCPQLFLTSDLHFGHRNIIEYCNRPFTDVDHMNEELVRRWNETVGPDDEVWVLGDVAMGKIDKSLEHVRRLNGTLRLVAGNHDRCWVGLGPKHEAWLDRYRDVGFVEIVTETEIDLGESVVVPACHFPYKGDSHKEDRYAERRPVDDGRWLLHGHVHDTWQVNGRQINVGTDVWGFAPVSAPTLRALITS